MSNENELNADLNSLMTGFITLKESFLKDQAVRLELQKLTKSLQEEVKVVRDLEKSERNNLNLSRKHSLEQQNTITNLLHVKGENLKLTGRIQELDIAVTTLRKQLNDERTKWQNERENLVFSQTEEMESLRLNYERKVSDLTNRIETLKSEKSSELTFTVFEYEERLHNLEDKLHKTEAESTRIRDQAAADVILYQKKVLALEQQINHMIQEKRQEKLLPQSASSFHKSPKNSKADKMRRNELYQHNTSPNTNSNNFSSVMKKIPVYKPIQIASEKDISKSSTTVFRNSENIFTGDGKHVYPNSLNSTTVVPTPFHRSKVSNASSRSSVMPKLEFVTDPPCHSSEETVSNFAQKPVCDTPEVVTQGRKFGIAKKRKLFCPNSMNFL